MEGAARQRGEALLDQLGLAVDEAGELGAVLEGAVGDAVDVGLVVLADVGGVGAGDGALVAHPGDRDGGVEASGEGDADALADGQGGEDLAHSEFLRVVVGARVASGGVGQGEEAAGQRVAAGGVAADDQDGVVAGDGAEDVGELGLVERRGEELRGTGRGAQHDEVGAGLGADEQLAAQAGQPLAGRRRSRRAGSRRSPPSPGTA